MTGDVQDADPSTAAFHDGKRRYVLAMFFAKRTSLAALVALRSVHDTHTCLHETRSQNNALLIKLYASCLNARQRTLPPSLQRAVNPFTKNETCPFLSLSVYSPHSVGSHTCSYCLRSCIERTTTSAYSDAATVGNLAPFPLLFAGVPGVATSAIVFFNAC